MAAIPIDADGRFSGYASVFNRIDAGGDMVMPGAFKRSLAKRPKQVRLLFQHDPKEPVGIWERLGEDAHGLLVAGRLVPGVARADALKRLIENGALDGLSIGFRTVRATREGGYAGQGDLEGIVVSAFTSVMVAAPLAPVHLRAERVADDDVSLGWVRCSRADGDGWGLGESPLEHSPERYLVHVWSGAVIVRTLDCFEASVLYSAAEQIADFGIIPTGFDWTVSQVSAALGAGPAAGGEFND